MACRVPPNAILQEFEPKACGHGVTDALAIYAIDVLGPTRVFQLLSEGGIDHTLCADTVPCTTFAGSAPKFSQLSITISGASGGRGSYLILGELIFSPAANGHWQPTVEAPAWT